jgi:hypothetical protein
VDDTFKWLMKEKIMKILQLIVPSTPTTHIGALMQPLRPQLGLGNG